MSSLTGSPVVLSVGRCSALIKLAISVELSTCEINPMSIVPSSSCSVACPLPSLFIEVARGPVANGESKALRSCPLFLCSMQLYSSLGDVTLSHTVELSALEWRGLRCGQSYPSSLL